MREECEAYGIEELRTLILNVGEKFWVDTFFVEKRLDVLEYIAAQPSQRKRKEEWKSDAVRACLATAALVYALEAVRYLEIAVALEEIPGMGYCEALAEVARQIADRDISYPY